jgi:hypothetical protein
MGATPAGIAKQASARNRATPAVSAISLAAVSTPQPGRLSRLGASRATRWRICPVSRSMRAVSAVIVAVYNLAISPLFAAVTLAFLDEQPS